VPHTSPGGCDSAMGAFTSGGGGGHTIWYSCRGKVTLSGGVGGGDPHAGGGVGVIQGSGAKVVMICGCAHGGGGDEERRRRRRRCVDSPSPPIGVAELLKDTRR